MKTLFVSLVALLFAFFLGCQSSITDPEVQEPTKSLTAAEIETFAYKDAISTWPGVIRLEGFMFDPSHRLNSFVEISGVVQYKFREVKLSKTSPHRSQVVSIYVNAELKSGCPNQKYAWTVKNLSEEFINSVNGTAQPIYIEKSMIVKNSCCSPLLLVFKFEVAGNKLNLVSKSLEITGGWFRIGDPEM